MVPTGDRLKRARIVVLRAIVTDDVPSGAVVAPKGRWAKYSLDGKTSTF